MVLRYLLSARSEALACLQVYSSLPVAFDARHTKLGTSVVLLAVPWGKTSTISLLLTSGTVMWYTCKRGQISSLRSSKSLCFNASTSTLVVCFKNRLTSHSKYPIIPRFQSCWIRIFVLLFAAPKTQQKTHGLAIQTSTRALLDHRWNSFNPWPWPC